MLHRRIHFGANTLPQRGRSTMSQHLTKLRLAGLISDRREEGRRHVYTGAKVNLSS